MRKFVRWLAVLSLFGLLAPAMMVAPVVAGDAEVGGACDETAFDTALATALTGGGGTITFDCGGPTTIVFSAQKTITAGNSVVIDGADQITLDGDNAFRHFTVEAGASLELRGLTLTNGNVEGDGGSIDNDGALTAVGSSFLGNAATSAGGAIASDGSLTIEDSTFTSNVADSGGAIISVGSLSISTSQFIENQGEGTFAGALLSAGGGSILDSSFIGNTSFFGGTVVNVGGNLDISGSSFLGNEALGTGGAIYNLAGLTITNSTFSNNIAPLGGAVFTGDGVAELIASTVTENLSLGDTSVASGSLDNHQGGQIILRQTIVANQTVGGDCFGTMTSSDNNLDSDNTCNLTGPNDIPGGDPDLGPLADNGGPTMTYMPATDSAVVDGGGFGCPATDQRGETRPSGSACDIGSVEVQQSTFVLCASYYTGSVVSPASGQCGPTQIELETPEDLPLSFCINTWTGAVQYTFGRPCNPPRQAHTVPDDGDLLTCVSLYTGSHRWVFNHSQCTPYELPNTISAA